MYMKLVHHSAVRRLRTNVESLNELLTVVVVSALGSKQDATGNKHRRVAVTIDPTTKKLCKLHYKVSISI